MESNNEEFRRYPYPHRLRNNPRRFRRYPIYRNAYPYYWNDWWHLNRPLNAVKVVETGVPKEQLNKPVTIESNNLVYMLLIIIIISLVILIISRNN